MKKKVLRRKLRKARREARSLREELDSFVEVDADALERRNDDLAQKLEERSRKLGEARAHAATLQERLNARDEEIARLKRADASPDEWRQRAHAMQDEVRRLEGDAQQKGVWFEQQRAAQNAAHLEVVRRLEAQIARLNEAAVAGARQRQELEALVAAEKEGRAESERRLCAERDEARAGLGALRASAARVADALGLGADACAGPAKANHGGPTDRIEGYPEARPTHIAGG